MATNRDVVNALNKLTRAIQTANRRSAGTPSNGNPETRPKFGSNTNQLFLIGVLQTLVTGVNDSLKAVGDASLTTSQKLIKATEAIPGGRLFTGFADAITQATSTINIAMRALARATRRAGILGGAQSATDRLEFERSRLASAAAFPPRSSVILQPVAMGIRDQQRQERNAVAQVDFLESLNTSARSREDLDTARARVANARKTSRALFRADRVLAGGVSRTFSEGPGGSGLPNISGGPPIIPALRSVFGGIIGQDNANSLVNFGIGAATSVGAAAFGGHRGGIRDLLTARARRTGALSSRGQNAAELQRRLNRELEETKRLKEAIEKSTKAAFAENRASFGIEGARIETLRQQEQIARSTARSFGSLTGAQRRQALFVAQRINTVGVANALPAELNLVRRAGGADFVDRALERRAGIDGDVFDQFNQEIGQEAFRDVSRKRQKAERQLKIDIALNETELAQALKANLTPTIKRIEEIVNEIAKVQLIRDQVQRQLDLVNR